MIGLEKEMLAPVRELLARDFGLDVFSTEVNLGYGIADLVGGELCQDSCRLRREMSLAAPLEPHFVRVLSAVRGADISSLRHVVGKVPLSEGTLRTKVLPRMESVGLLERTSNGSWTVLKSPPDPLGRIVAVELKLRKWSEAVLQARRYSFFADQSYVALPVPVCDRVDRALLYRHRLGLIGVDGTSARELIPAPKRHPRSPVLHRLCAEYLYAEQFSGNTPEAWAQ